MTNENPTASRADLRIVSVFAIDRQHAKFMRDLTGSATVEERDTWVSKSDAAKFVLGLTDVELEAEIALVTSNHTEAADDLATLIFDVGDKVADVRAIATVVHAKSLAYKRLIGFASKVRREAKQAVMAATDDAVPLEDVAAAIEAVNVAMMAQVASAIVEWQGT